MYHRNLVSTALSVSILTLLAACSGGSGGTGSSGSGSGPGGNDPLAPANLAYDQATAAWIVELQTSPLTPTWSGEITQFFVLPPLPAGMTIDAVTGRISGTPLVPAARQTYTVTGSSLHGSTQAELELRVTEAPSLLAGTFADGTLVSFRVDPFSGGLETLGLDYSPLAAGSLQGIALHPNGTIAYTGNLTAQGSDQDLSIFGLDPATGLPEWQGSVPFLEGAHEIALTRDGELAVVISRANHRIQSFAVDGETGALSPIGQALPTGTSPDRVRVDPLGRYAVVQNENSLELRAYAISAADGSLEAAGGIVFTSPPRRPTDIAISEDGDQVFVTFEQTSVIQRFPVTFNSGTGVVGFTYGEQTPTGLLPTSISLGPRGTHVLVACSGSNEVRSYAIDRETGDLTLASTLGLGTAPRQVCLDESGSFAFVTYSGSPEITTLSVDARTHALTRVGGIRARPGLQRLAIVTSPDTQTAVARNVYSVNLGSEGLSPFAVDPLTDLLTSSGAEFSLGLQPDLALMDPRGGRVFVAEAASRTLSVLALDDEGNLSGLLPTSVTLPAPPKGLALDGSARYLFVTVDEPGALLLFEVTGAGSFDLLQTLELTGHPCEVTCDPTGRFVHVSGEARIDTFEFERGALAWEPQSVFAPGNPSLVRFSRSGAEAYFCLEQSHLIVPAAVHPQQGTLGLVAGGTLAIPADRRPVDFMPEPGSSWGVALLQADAAGQSWLLRVSRGEDGLLLTETASDVLPFVAGGATLGPRGLHLYVSEPGADRLHVLALDGSLLTTASTQDLPTGVTPGQVLVRRGIE